MSPDPTETWSATFAASGQSASAKLAETQAALFASQQDLTRVERERGEEIKALRILADQYLAILGEVGKALATARYQNQRLTAELGSALRKLGGEP